MMNMGGCRHRMLRLAVLNVIQLLVGVFDFTSGHGRLWEPPSRSSMWRRGYNTTININDNELSCGGFTNQWIKYGGLCGVCGDPYQQYPRDNEIGGKYASGIVTRTYPIGGTIDVTIGLTANHMGYFEFRLCPILDPATGESQYCMDKHQLKIINGEDNGYRFYIRDQKLDGFIDMTLKLPRNFLCKHCVLQWKYHTGTRWGCDSNLICGKGIGPQEEFYGCSDISIQDVSKIIYNEPDLKTKSGEGQNHLGAFKKSHTVIWSIKPTVPANYQTSNLVKDTKVVIESHTRRTLSHRHNKHMATLRHFLEELTLNALFSYYGPKDKSKAFRCRPTVKYEKNPIVNEFCIKVCSHDLTVCPDILCSCSQNTNSRAENRQTYQIKQHKLDRNHLKNFARELISKNRLVENFPADVIEKDFRGHNVYPESEGRQTNIPRLGKMQVFKHSENHLPIFHDDRKSTKALQESSFLPLYGVQHNIGNRHLTNFMTTKGLDFRSTLDPDKIVHLPSQEVIKPKIMLCTASISFAHNPFMAKWCNTNCRFGFCPPRVCSCNY
ncbi:uncharacterized protein LOC132725634 [Ruditapes philippinarum]|uniref:uncharacterized protein LOC132725634 n=1 Tax=Ruditapes philippinarum TaxID=129788 RepID=UPI00295AD69E|nr:uncharacterized protein LOC132725634 [Ruditapes philippinarum]